MGTNRHFRAGFSQKIVSNLRFIKLDTTFVKQCKISGIEEELERGTHVTMKILSLIYRSPSASTVATSYEKPSINRSRRKCCNRRDHNFRSISEESYEKCKQACSSRSSGSSSRFRSRKLAPKKMLQTHCSDKKLKANYLVNH